LEGVILLIDWENVLLSLRNLYGVELPYLNVLRTIGIEARKRGELKRGMAFYGSHLQDDELVGALTFVNIEPHPIYVKRAGGIQKEEVDHWLIAEGVRACYKVDPEILILVTGDRGYAALLKVFKDEGRKNIVFLFKKSAAKLYQEESFLYDEIVYLDDVFKLAIEQPPEKTPEVVFVKDLKRCVISIQEQILKLEVRLISKRKLRQELGLSSASFDREWKVWDEMIDEAEKEKILIKSGLRMRDGRLISHYKPNLFHPWVSELFLWLAIYLSAVRTSPNGEAILSTLLDDLAKDDQQRDTIKNLHNIAQERGIVSVRKVPSPKDPSHLSTVLSVNEEHPLTKWLKDYKPSATFLPENWIANIEDLSKKLGEEEQPIKTTIQQIDRESSEISGRAFVLAAQQLGFLSTFKSISPYSGKETTMCKFEKKMFTKWLSSEE